MNQRDAKRHACSFLANRAERGAEDMDEALNPEDDHRVSIALWELCIEMYERAGEPGQADWARQELDGVRERGVVR